MRRAWALTAARVRLYRRGACARQTFPAVERQRHNNILAVTGQNAFELAANAFCVDPVLLKTQCDEVLPLACDMFHSGPQMTSREAWRRAVAVQQRTARCKGSLGALVRVLSRWCAWSMAITGVERTFAKQACAAPVTRAAVSQALAADELVLISTSPDDGDDDLVVAEARVFGQDV